MKPFRGLALRSTLIIIAVIAAVLVGLYYFLVDPYSSRLLQFRLNDMVSAASVPEDIADAAYLLTPANGGGIYRGGTLEYDAYERNGSFVVDIAYAAGREFQIVFDPASRSYVVTADGAPVFSSPTQLLHLFVSPDAGRIAVAKRNAESVFEAEPSAWDVVVIDAASGATWDVEGFAAVFLNPGTLLAFRADGIAAVYYESGIEEAALDLATALVYPSIAQTSDASKVAWTTLDGDLYVYDVLQSAGVGLAELKSGKTEEIRSRVALTDANVYEIVLREDGIFSDEAAQVRSLPSSLSTTKLIP